MKTRNVYLGRIYKVHSYSNGWLYGIVNLEYKKSAVMVRKNILGFDYMKDLETGHMYRMKLSKRKGTLYVSKSYLEKFNRATSNSEEKLPKEKILKLGKEYLNK